MQDLSFTQVLIAQPCHALCYLVNLQTNISNFDYVTAVLVLPGQCLLDGD